jgi:hypothetical protein
MATFVLYFPTWCYLAANAVKNEQPLSYIVRELVLFESISALECEVECWLPSRCTIYKSFRAVDLILTDHAFCSTWTLVLVIGHCISYGRLLETVEGLTWILCCSMGSK